MRLLHAMIVTLLCITNPPFGMYYILCSCSAQPQAQHEEMVEGLLLEARMRTRIAELREYRRNGIRTFADAEVGAKCSDNIVRLLGTGGTQRDTHLR